MLRMFFLAVCCVALLFSHVSPEESVAQQQQKQQQNSQKAKAKSAEQRHDAKSKQVADDEAGFVALNKQRTVLVDAAGKRLLLKAEVCSDSAALEMLCCIKKTKEHEAILSLDAKAYLVHAGLIAINARRGKPVSWSPDFQPPTGQKIDIYLSWTDNDGRFHREKAQTWMRHSVMRYFEYSMKQLPKGFTIPKDSELRYDKFTKELLWFGPMTVAERDKLLKDCADTEYQKAIQHFFKSGQSRPMQGEWVFAGSRMSRDFDTGKAVYQAEGGDLICVANFPSATLDLTSESSASDDGRLYEAWTERIPKVGTPVTIELIPQLRSNSADKSAAGQETDSTRAEK